MNEESFRLALDAERKRSDRSERGFLIILLDVSQIFAEGPARSAEILRNVNFPIRETDFRGWETAGEKFGVVFTQLERTIAAGLAEMLVGKVLAALAEELGEEAARQVPVEIIRYPEPIDRDDDTIDPDIFPEVFRKTRRRGLSQANKRLLDILGSLAALVALAPVMATLAALVKLTSPGPVLYRCRRVGRFGQQFDFLKFRSMRVDADPKVHRAFVSDFIEGNLSPAAFSGNGNGDGDGAAVFKLVDDERITPIGGFLRRSSLDELPQFWHVLTGKMSLVGPRPPLFYELKKYRPWHRRRVLEAKPGITGLWQVEGRSRTTFDEMVRMDLDYIRRQSLWLDLKILSRTPRAVISGKGAR